MTRNVSFSLKGYAVVRAKYDDRGNVVEAAFYGADDRLLPQPEGYARVTGTYGDEGRLVNEAFFDAEDRPAHTNQNYATPFSYSQMRNEYTPMAS